MLGVASLSLAAVLSWRNRGGPWRSIAVLLILMALDVATGASWLLHESVGSMLRGNGMYDGRRPLQLAAVAGVGAAAAAAAVLLARRFAGPTRHAVVAVAALAALSAVAPLSLHAVDAVLGRAVGPVRAIALLWAAGAAWIGAAAWTEHRNRKGRRGCGPAETLSP